MRQSQFPHRLFFAILPPSRVVAAILSAAEEWPEIRAVGARLVEPGRMHVTAHFIGAYAEISSSLVSAAISAGASLRHDVVAVHFDTLRCFVSPGHTHPIVLTGETCGGATLHCAVGSALQAQGLGVDSRDYLPHMTLSYDGAEFASRTVDGFGWIADSLVLVHSQTGSGYSVLGRWPLR